MAKNVSKAHTTIVDHHGLMNRWNILDAVSGCCKIQCLRLLRLCVMKLQNRDYGGDLPAPSTQNRFEMKALSRQHLKEKNWYHYVRWHKSSD